MLTHLKIPRNYVSHLEAQVKRLNQEIRQLQAQQNPALSDSSVDVAAASDGSGTSTPAERSTTSKGGSDQVQDLVKSFRNAIVEPSKQPRFLGPSSGITLARMVMASIRMDKLPTSRTLTTHGPPSHVRSSSASTSASAPAAEASLPPRQAADHLVDVYFQYRTPHLPIIQEVQAKKAIDHAYACMSGHQPMDRTAERDVFITYMVFAISLCNVPNPTGGTCRPVQSEGCFRSAVHWIEKVITYSKSDLEVLRAVLLLAQFVSMCPWRGSLWHLTGIALRLCIDMGLHWETEEQALHQDQDLLYERRRLWYSTYHFDRVLGIILGRPFGITDESTRVPLPNPWSVAQQPLSSPEGNSFDTHHQRAHNHMFSMAQLESEIKHVQQSRTWALKVAYPRPNYKLWVQDIQPRLQEWFSTIPNPASAHPLSIFANQAYWDYMYNNAILLLYRPNSTAQHPSPEAMLISYDASCKVITSIKSLQRDGRLDVLWKSVCDLFMAGLTVIYSVWQSAPIRSMHPVSKIIVILQSCASTLSAMSENFSGAGGCRDTFDALSQATVDWLVTSDAEETSRSRALFQEQIGHLLENLQPPGTIGTTNGNGPSENGTNDISTMLSGDGFAFGQMLSSAAQWPDVEGLEFGDMEFDVMTGAGVDLRAYTF